MELLAGETPMAMTLANPEDKLQNSKKGQEYGLSLFNFYSFKLFKLPKISYQFLS